MTGGTVKVLGVTMWVRPKFTLHPAYCALSSRGNRPSHHRHVSSSTRAFMGLELRSDATWGQAESEDPRGTGVSEPTKETLG